jgi:hypothetical protein
MLGQTVRPTRPARATSLTAERALVDTRKVKSMPAAVAASSEWTDETGVRQPAGDVHAWQAGHNQTLCGLPLRRTALRRFPHVPFDFQRTDVLTDADPIGRICPRCVAATRGRPRRGREFRRP